MSTVLQPRILQDASESTASRRTAMTDISFACPSPWIALRKGAFLCGRDRTKKICSPYVPTMRADLSQQDAGTGKKFSKRELRRKIISGDKFNRMGFRETREAAEGVMHSAYTSPMIDEFRSSGYEITRGQLRFRLAKAYGFCWGVERAVALAFETRQKFPKERIWITNEIIHNPSVNKQMADAGVLFVSEKNGKKDLSGIESGDVVILPAFGATLDDMLYLTNLGVQIVDTTCPWVSKVWGALDKHQKADCTSIIHGKWRHEETVATTSFAEKYVVVLNMNEAQYVADYILHGGDKEEFLRKFENAMSKGFDPDTDLRTVGVANQTTMLKSETYDIGKLFEGTMMKKYGLEKLNDHFVVYDTICDATQERQDAMAELLDNGGLDMMLVIGGFNSSNTSHLQEMAELRNLQSYWVSKPSCVGPGNRILSRNVKGEEKVTFDWLPNRPLTIGVTSGASTPDKVVEETLDRICTIHNLQAAVGSP